MGSKHRKIKIGKTYYRLIPIEYLGVSEISLSKRGKVYRCLCTCGNTVDVPGIYIGRGIKSCGCFQKESREKLIDPGTAFGKLTVVELAGNIRGRGYCYLCKCSCERNKEVIVRGANLRSGDTQSCGCLHDSLFRENAKKAYKKMFIENTNIARIASTGLQKNNTSGIKGVSWHKGRKKWVARIHFQGINRELGYYDDINEAARARLDAEKTYFHPIIEKYKKKDI